MQLGLREVWNLSPGALAFGYLLPLSGIHTSIILRRFTMDNMRLSISTYNVHGLQPLEIFSSTSFDLFAPYLGEYYLLLP